MLSRFFTPAAISLALLTGSTAGAQSSADAQARALLEDGRAYWAKKQYKQALENFNTIVTGFSNSDSVDKALLEIGRYYLEIEGNLDKARESFDQIAKRYPQSEGAPGAYYYLGMMSLNAATSVPELDEAIAQFKRLQRLYPRSAWVPRALHSTGLAHRRAGRLEEAVEEERRVALEHPTSDAAAAAQFQVGHLEALLGDPQHAMEEFQRVRNRYPESDWAPTALDRITALYRLYGAARPTFSKDPSYALAAGEALKDVRGLLMTPERVLWLASEKVKYAVSFDPDGKRGESYPVEDSRGLSWAPRRGIVVVAKLAVRVGKDLKSFAAPSDKPGMMRPLEKINAAVVTPAGSLLVADGDKDRIYKYDAEDRYVGTFPDAKEHQISRMALDGEGGIILLDRSQRTLNVYDESGKLLRTVGPRGAGFEFKKPSDVAADTFRNLYVADEESGIFIFSPAGQLLASLAGEDIRRPKAVTVDLDGSLLVYDDKTERVVRFR